MGWEAHAEEVANAAQLAQSQFYTACSKARLADTSAAAVGERLAKSALFGSVIGADSSRKDFKIAELTEEQGGFSLVTRASGSKADKRAEAKGLIDSSLVALTLAHDGLQPGALWGSLASHRQRYRRPCRRRTAGGDSSSWALGFGGV
jgi:hypothetical protein